MKKEEGEGGGKRGRRRRRRGSDSCIFVNYGEEVKSVSV